MTRPLALTFQEDAVTHDLEDTFMCGDALLVAPVLEQGATSRAVYLPSGSWCDFWTGAQREGPGWIEAEAPLKRIPVFVRGGAVVPLGPAVEHVGQRRGEPLALHLYPAQALGRFSPDGPAQRPPAVSWLYEDDGETVAHERGEFRVTRFTLATTGARLELRREVEGRFVPSDDRFVVVVHGVDGPPLAVEGMPGAELVCDVDAGCLRLTGGPFERLSLVWP